MTEVVDGTAGGQSFVVNGQECWAEAFGDPADPAVLLVAGTGCSMDWWRDAFCRALSARGCFVVRYDLRDTGRSVADPPGEPAYGLRDLVDDAVGVLDAHGVHAAHWAGFSMGAWIAQLAALDHADRVNGLTLLSTRPTGHGPNDADLPEMTPQLLATFTDPPPEPDWDDSDAVVTYLVDGERPFASPNAPFDVDDAAAYHRRMVARTRNIASALTNHVVADQGDPWRDRLGDIGVATTIVHGHDDPLFPPANARALAREIPGARLLMLPAVGHELPARVRPTVCEVVARAAVREDV